MRKYLLLLSLIISIPIGYLLVKTEAVLTLPQLNEAEENIPALSINSIFNEDHSWTASFSADRIRIITITGDIIPARTVNYEVVRRNNPLWPYEKVSDKINSLGSDIVFINLEAPLTTQCQVTVEGMSFCGSSSNIDGIKSIKTGVANLANNHSSNLDQEGLNETMALLKKAGIEYTGVNNLVIKDVRGLKFAFLGYNDIPPLYKGLSIADEETMEKEISEARSKADVVLVQFHFGTEYLAQPDERQKYLAHYAIDSGADLVIGNHPHWIQPVEIYKGKLITYAHGNFIFDQMWSQKTREGVMGVYTFYDNALIDVRYLPLQSYDYGQARFLEGEDKKRVLEDMKLQSEILSKSSSF